MTFTKNDIDDYQNRLTKEQSDKVIEHCNEYDIKPNICAWYDNLEDFYSDWCGELNYSKEEADSLLADNPNEFLTFSDGSIVRFVK